MFENKFYSLGILEVTEKKKKNTTKLLITNIV